MEITLTASPENERKQRILRALEEANDRGIEKWIWKVLGDWADGYYARKASGAIEEPAGAVGAVTEADSGSRG